MKIRDLITPALVAADVQVTSKKRTLEFLSNLIVEGHPELEQLQIFDCFVARERLGSTGIGHGVAIPHGRLKNIDNAIGAFIKLVQPIDFDAIDNQPVDMLFSLLVPEQSTEEHLQILAALAEMFSNTSFCDRLRHAQRPDELYALLSEWEPAQAQHAVAPGA